MNKISKLFVGLGLCIGTEVYATEAQVFYVGPDSTGNPGNVSWPSPRFAPYPNNAGACEIDHLTGLMWVRDLNSAGANNGAPLSWADAKSFITTLNTSSGWCGFHDWRLPNVNELKSLTNYQDTSSPADWLNSSQNDGFSNVLSSNYWSSTESPSTVNAAWAVYMGNGYVGFNPETSSFNIWPVRGGQ